MQAKPETVDLTPYGGTLVTLSAAAEVQLDKRGIPKKLGPQFRAMKDMGYEKDAHTVTMSVSSEEPVQRYYGTEILSHKAGAIRLGRLKQGMALLFNHNMDDHLGITEDYELKDGILRTVNRFGTNPLALEKEGDVASGILRYPSIGYQVYEWDIVENAKTGQRTYTATDWEPYENSLVTVPADPTVGVNRSADPQVAVRMKFRKVDDNGDTVEDDDPDDPDEPEDGARKVSEPDTTTSEPQRTPIMAEPTVDLAAERNARATAIRAVRTANPTFYTEDQFFSDLQGERSIAEIKEQVADKIIAASKRSDVPTLGDTVTDRMSDKERRSYSMVRLLRSAINQRFPGTFSDDAEAGFEREVSDSIRTEAAKRGISVGGGLQVATNMPFNPSRAIQAAAAGLGTGAMQARTLTAGSSTVGGAVINTLTETTPIELLRAVTVCLRLGATQLSGVKGLFRIPRQTAATSVNWLAESANGTNSDLALDDITFAPNRMNKVGSYTLELLNQEAFAVEDLLRMDQTIVEALALDYAGLAGSGTNNVPLGLLNRTGLATILTGSSRNMATGVVTPGGGGAPTTFVDLNNAEAIISGANADEGGMAWAFTPQVRAALRSTPKFPGGIMDPIWPSTSVVSARGIQDGPLGYRAAISTQLPRNLSFTPQGGSLINGLHSWVLGYWPSLMFVDWGVRELVVDNITKAASGTYQIIENSLHDNNVRHMEHFVACMSAQPS